MRFPDGATGYCFGLESDEQEECQAESLLSQGAFVRETMNLFIEMCKGPLEGPSALWTMVIQYCYLLIVYSCGYLS